jgi:hypothetical protein
MTKIVRQMNGWTSRCSIMVTPNHVQSWKAASWQGFASNASGYHCRGGTFGQALAGVVVLAVLWVSIALVRGHRIKPAAVVTRQTFPPVETYPPLSSTSFGSVQKLTHSRTSARSSESTRDSPHLSQFPSPQPLNAQEEILARYVRENAQEAVLLAQARAALLKKDLLEFHPDQFSEDIIAAGRIEIKQGEHAMHSRTAVFATIVGMVLYRIPLTHAQDENSTSKQSETRGETKGTAKSSHRQPTACRFDFSINELEEGKKLNTRIVQDVAQGISSNLVLSRFRTHICFRIVSHPVSHSLYHYKDGDAIALTP